MQIRIVHMSSNHMHGSQLLDSVPPAEPNLRPGPVYSVGQHLYVIRNCMCWDMSEC